MTKLKAPPHLAKSTQAWWLAVARDYALEEHHLKLLTSASEAWDRAVQAREAIEKHGLIFTDRFNQPRARPEVSIERDSRLAFSKMLRELQLDADPTANFLPALRA